MTMFADLGLFAAIPPADPPQRVKGEGSYGKPRPDLMGAWGANPYKAVGVRRTDTGVVSLAIGMMRAEDDFVCSLVTLDLDQFAAHALRNALNAALPEPYVFDHIQDVG